MIYQDGGTKHLTRADFRVEVLDRWKSPRSGGDYPMRWRVAIPSEGIELEIVPFFPEQELDTRKSTRVTYWEGAVQVKGSYRGKPAQGLGYVEMTGYMGKLKV